MTRRLTAFPAQWLAVVAILVSLPWWVPGDYVFHLATMSVIWSIAAVALNLVMGYTGLLSVAHGALAMVGGYTASLLVVERSANFWLALLAGALLAAVVGFFLGVLTLRLRGHYFAISTMAFGIVVALVLEKWESVTGGARGITYIPPPDSVTLPVVGTVEFTTDLSKYFLAVAILAVVVAVVRNLVHSRFGRALAAVRSNELVARSQGVNVVGHKLAAFTISAFIAGVGGTLYATYLAYLNPNDASLWTSFFILMYVVLGGMGTTWGPVLGAFFVVMVPEWLRLFDEYRVLLIGVLLIVTITFLPGGLMQGLNMLGRLVRRAATAVRKSDLRAHAGGRPAAEVRDAR